jgi:hypothetical protein
MQTLKRTDGGFDKGLYGAGEFGYSMETATSANATAVTASATFGGILNLDTEFSSSHAGVFGS